MVSLVLLALSSFQSTSNAEINIRWPIPVNSSRIVIQPGQTVDVAGTQVYCSPNHGVPSIQIQTDRCDSFHSDSSCQNAHIGSDCLTSAFSDAQKGHCVRVDNFGGKPNCKCR